VRCAEVVAWLQQQMVSGCRAKTGFRGEAMRDMGVMFTESCPMSFSCLKSDQAQKKQMHLFDTSAQHDRVCEQCLAHKKRMEVHYSGVGVSAGWASTLVTSEQYLASARRVTPWAAVPGWRLERHAQDGMHLLFKRGCASDLIASLIFEWIEDEGEFEAKGVSLEEDLLRVSKHFQQWREDNHVKSHRTEAFTCNRLSRFTAACFPSVTDRYKCGDVRVMLAWAAQTHLQFSKRKQDSDVEVLREYDKIRLNCVTSLCSYLQLTAQAGPMLTDGERRQAHEFSETSLTCYMHLARTALARGRLLYYVRPKWHGFAHISLGLARGNRENPRLWEVWADEDLCGIAARRNNQCHSGTVLVRSSQRYVAWLTIFCDLAGLAGRTNALHAGLAGTSPG